MLFSELRLYAWAKEVEDKLKKEKQRELCWRRVLAIPKKGFAEILNKTVRLDGCYLLIQDLFSDGSTRLITVLDEDLNGMYQPEKCFAKNVRFAINVKPKLRRLALDLE